MRLSRAIKQLLNLRLLVANDKTCGKRAVTVVNRHQTVPLERKGPPR